MRNVLARTPKRANETMVKRLRSILHASDHCEARESLRRLQNKLLGHEIRGRFGYSGARTGRRHSRPDTAREVPTSAAHDKHGRTREQEIRRPEKVVRVFPIEDAPYRQKRVMPPLVEAMMLRVLEFARGAYPVVEG
jgi:transposase-like protein